MRLSCTALIKISGDHCLLPSRPSLNLLPRLPALHPRKVLLEELFHCTPGTHIPPVAGLLEDTERFGTNSEPSELQAIGRWWLMWEFGNDTMADRDACIKAYLQHNERIKASRGARSAAGVAGQRRGLGTPVQVISSFVFGTRNTHNVISHGPSFPKQNKFFLPFLWAAEHFPRAKLETHPRFHDRDVRHATV